MANNPLPLSASRLSVQAVPIRRFHILPRRLVSHLTPFVPLPERVRFIRFRGSIFRSYRALFSLAVQVNGE